MRIAEFSPLFSRYRTKGLLLDTNLFLLLLVGRFVPEQLSTFNPISNQGYTPDDFDLLREIVSLVRPIMCTPHILTEVSNHADKLKGTHRARVSAGLAQLLQNAHEAYTDSRTLSNRSDFLEFGLTDVAITEVSAGRYLVMTVDFDLFVHLRRNGVDAINFTDLRKTRWGF